MMFKPHGGNLVNNFIDSSKIDNDLFILDVDLRLKKEIENISFGVFSPLEGFVSEEDFLSILKNGRLNNGLPWTIPIVFDIDNDFAKKVKDASEVALRNNGKIFGILYIKDLYRFDKLQSAKLIFQTDDRSHPGVYNYLTMKDTLMEGQIKTLNPHNSDDKKRLTPMQVRDEINNRRWKNTVAFQTRNVPHVAHEMLQKAVLNIYDGLFINPLIGKKKTGDFKDEVILESYQSLINNYYPISKIIFSTLHTEMRYAGPKEAIHHAIIRKNFGCSHIIIGRDHAGVGNYYTPFAAHDIFKEYPDLEIEPIFFPAFYYCKKCSHFANERICPHDSNFKEELSGTKMRKMFLSGEVPPHHLMRSEISKVISSYQNPFVE
jgi:sulfate adenylyltransferase